MCRDKEIVSIYNKNDDYSGVLRNAVIPNVIVIDENGNKVVKDIFSALNDNRIILCDGEINDGLASVIIAQILQLTQVNPKQDIFMYINSPGGSVTSGMAIFDAMLNSKCKIHTVGMGMCASMGAFLLSAGKCTGSASALPNTEIMIHQPLGGGRGQATDLEIMADRIKLCKKELTGYITYFCSLDPKSTVGKIASVEEQLKKVGADMERDYYLSADEALEYGLINKIVEVAPDKDHISKIKALGYI